jgi:sulfur-carrier protein adenylyltransferase/sulfurtransferase
MTQPGEPFGRLSPEAASERINTGELKVVDVREPWEYARDHIPAAKLTPLGQIIARPQEAITVTDNILFVCEVGQRSAVAAELAAAAGKEHVFNLEGGMQAWRNAGLPTEA